MLRALFALLVMLPLCAACGSAPATSAPSAPPVPAGALDPGPGAAFAPAGALLYIRSAETGSSWDALSRYRAEMKGVKDFDGSNDEEQLFARFLTGVDLAAGDPAMLKALGGETALVLLSDHVGHPKPDWVVPDEMVYSSVRDRAALESYLGRSNHRAGSAGEYALYEANDSAGGASAVSDHVWLWASSMQNVRAALATAAGQQPSLADDPGFRAAIARVDGHDAAFMAYTRGDLATELRLFVLGDHGGNSDLGLTPALGLDHTAFAVGADAHGIWLHSSPNVEDGYTPGEAFAPTLDRRVPEGAFGYVGLSGLAAQHDQLNHALGVVLGDERAGVIEMMSKSTAGLQPSQLGPFGSGEQAWWIGDRERGAAYRPDDPGAAAETLAAAAAVQNTFTGSEHVSSGRDGDVVWIGAGPQRPASKRIPELLSEARLPDQVSLVVAVDVKAFGGLQLGSQPGPESSVSGLVMATSAGPTDSSYDLTLFFEIR